MQMIPREDALRVEMTRRCSCVIIARCFGGIQLAGMPLCIEMAELNERGGVAGFRGLAEEL
jgi:hypothetical protein